MICSFCGEDGVYYDTVEKKNACSKCGKDHKVLADMVKSLNGVKEFFQADLKQTLPTALDSRKMELYKILIGIDDLTTEICDFRSMIGPHD